MTLRIRRGTEADRTTITPAEGELIYVTDEKTLYVGDGTTAGGVPPLPLSSTPNAGDTPRFERTLSTTSNVVNTASRIVKRNTNVTTLAYDLGGPALNFGIQAGDGATLTAENSIGLLGAKWNGGSTAYNHSFELSLLAGNSGGSGTTFDTVLTISRLKADFDVPIKPQTFATNTTRDSHYVTFTEPDASPEEGDIIYLTSDPSSKPRLQVYNNGDWYSLLTRRFAFTDGGYGPTFTREESGAETATSALRLVRRRTDDTVDTNDRNGPSLRFDFAYGTGTDNETPFAYIGTIYKGSTGDHEIAFNTQTSGTITSIFYGTRKKVEFNVPARLVDYATTTARDAAVTSPQAGMMIYLSATNKAQVYNGTSWIDLH